MVRYSAAISGELGNTTGCRRGEIAGRWTKPVAATRLAASHGKPSRCRGPDLGKGSAGLGVSALAHRDAHATLARPASHIGTGHLYQGRFKSFPVESDEHLYTVLRYVERNPVRANLVQRAQDWRWSGAWRRHRGDDQARGLLSPWPMTRPTDWLRRVNRAECRGELEALRRCVQRGQPYGSEPWRLRITAQLGLESTFRPRGRPRKPER